MGEWERRKQIIIYSWQQKTKCRVIYELCCDVDFFVHFSLFRDSEPLFCPRKITLLVIWFEYNCWEIEMFASLLTACLILSSLIPTSESRRWTLDRRLSGWRSCLPLCLSISLWNNTIFVNDFRCLLLLSQTCRMKLKFLSEHGIRRSRILKEQMDFD